MKWGMVLGENLGTKIPFKIALIFAWVSIHYFGLKWERRGGGIENCFYWSEIGLGQHAPLNL